MEGGRGGDERAKVPAMCSEHSGEGMSEDFPGKGGEPGVCSKRRSQVISMAEGDWRVSFLGSCFRASYLTEVLEPQGAQGKESPDVKSTCTGGFCLPGT